MARKNQDGWMVGGSVVDFCGHFLGAILLVSSRGTKITGPKSHFVCFVSSIS